MTSKYKAIAFDMDGTLIDSMYAWRGVFREFIRNHGFTMPDEIVGVPEYPVGWAAKLLEDQLGDMTVAEAIEEMYRLVDAHYATDTCARPGAMELVKRLKEEGYTLAVATATPLRYANTALKRLGFDGLFDLVVSDEELGAGKGETVFFTRLADMLHVKPEEILMFEDAYYSIRTAKEAGLGVCAIEDYYAWRERDQIRALADRYISCYADLLEEDI